MALKPYTMSFKESNSDEVKLHKNLSSKTSPMAFAKDVLIEVLVREKSFEIKKEIKAEENSCSSELEDIFGM